MAQEKTEEPTPKKLRQARERGELARSRELQTALVLLAVAGALAASGAAALDGLVELFEVVFQAVAAVPRSPPTAALAAGASLGLQAAWPLVAAALAAGTFASFIQIGPLFTTKPLEPKWERVDPIQGAKRLFSQRQLVELVKTLLKMVLILWVLWEALEDGVYGIAQLPGRGAAAVLDAGATLILTLLLRVGGAMAGIAVLDVVYQRWRHRQDQKMTKEEVKREHKETEGDPHSKQARDRAHREIVEHSALEEVRSADVLVVNPTHVAVALRYDDAHHEAPEVVAKGQEGLARRMIDAARAAGVPIMRDVPLARALHELELGEEIPEDLYEAVAAVLRAAYAEREEVGESGPR
jgi:flagellar biosynthesis protein FlhB